MPDQQPVYKATKQSKWYDITNSIGYLNTILSLIKIVCMMPKGIGPL
ncbi:uncharacterized protein METZ01_LOCUS92774 [marine metagenome]|uniref:Uncharacterized protein n=1 Tax=marine metagenome TaxID=408172 RepID=A0A381VHY3_9ZZZZ